VRRDPGVRPKPLRTRPCRSRAIHPRHLGAPNCRTQHAGGNGCDYKGTSTGPLTLTADTISDAGIYKTIFDIVFRAKGKIVNFILMIPGDGVPKALMLALATYTISKPINTLKDPT